MKETLLLIGLFICHFLADYTHLSTAWMLNAKRLGKPIYPIFTHAFIHASLMLVLLALVFGLSGFKLALLFVFQLITHFLIDVWKGRMNGWVPTLQSPANKWHWVVFGFDQLLHAIVIILMVKFAL
jgi:hypothetical protein